MRAAWPQDVQHSCRRRPRASRQATLLDAVAVIGASGFVGSRALALARRQGRRVRALTHCRPLPQGVETVQGDAADAATLDRLLEPGAVVLNFAYGGDESGERLAAALAEGCARHGVRRIVHASTISVYGTTPGESVDEGTACAPVTAYERTKYAIERILERKADRYELAILRPTAVFGPGGKNLEALALRVLRRPWPWRYVRACATGPRRMHAVDVEYVAAAALFLADVPLPQPCERFIVSQDDEPDNNYAALEAFFVHRFGATRYPFPPLFLPSAALRWALRASGRSNVEPQRRYSSAKLAERGFQSPRSFEDALAEYAEWIKRHASP